MIKVVEPEARREYEALMNEVLNEAEGTGDRARLMANKIADAIQAHRSWALTVQWDAQVTGYAAAVKTYLKRTRVVVNIEDREVAKPRTIGVKRRDDEGNVVDLQLPLEVLTFDQVREKRAEYLRQQKAYTDNVAVADRLLALEDLAPGCKTPADAVAELGLTLEEYLAAAS